MRVALATALEDNMRLAVAVASLQAQLSSAKGVAGLPTAGDTSVLSESSVEVNSDAAPISAASEGKR